MVVLRHNYKKGEKEKRLEQGFSNPPNSAQTWVLWDWINATASREGITKDLESMKEVGVLKRILL